MRRNRHRVPQRRTVGYDRALSGRRRLFHWAVDTAGAAVRALRDFTRRSSRTVVRNAFTGPCKMEQRTLKRNRRGAKAEVIWRRLYGERPPNGLAAGMGFVASRDCSTKGIDKRGYSLLFGG